MFGSGMTDGLAAGAAFGVMFIGLAQAGQGAACGRWCSEQTSSLLLVLVIAIRSRVPLRPAIRAAGGPALVGASGMTATLLYFYATHFAMLATAAVLVSLYPGVTVLLARVLLHERFNPVQRAWPAVHPRRDRYRPSADAAPVTLRPMPQIASTVAGERRRRRPAPGRHWVGDHAGGSRMSRPSKKPAICPGRAGGTSGPSSAL